MKLIATRTANRKDTAFRTNNMQSGNTFPHDTSLMPHATKHRPAPSFLRPAPSPFHPIETLDLEGAFQPSQASRSVLGGNLPVVCHNRLRVESPDSPRASHVIPKRPPTDVQSSNGRSASMVCFSLHKHKTLQVFPLQRSVRVLRLLTHARPVRISPDVYCKSRFISTRH